MIKNASLKKKKKKKSLWLIRTKTGQTAQDDIHPQPKQSKSTSSSSRFPSVSLPNSQSPQFHTQTQYSTLYSFHSNQNRNHCFIPLFSIFATPPSAHIHFITYSSPESLINLHLTCLSLFLILILCQPN